MQLQDYTTHHDAHDGSTPGFSRTESFAASCKTLLLPLHILAPAGMRRAVHQNRAKTLSVDRGKDPSRESQKSTGARTLHIAISVCWAALGAESTAQCGLCLQPMCRKQCCISIKVNTSRPNPVTGSCAPASANCQRQKSAAKYGLYLPFIASKQERRCQPSGRRFCG